MGGFLESVLLLQPHTLALVILLCTTLYLLSKKDTKQEKKEEKAAQPKKKPVRREAADDSDEEEIVEDDVSSGRKVDHVPFKHEELPLEQMVQKSAYFYTEMNKRRTLRYYSNRPVPKEVIDNLIRAAGTAPSGAHTEPWTFVVAEDPDIKQSIRDIVEEEEETNYRKRMGKKWVEDLRFLKTNWEKPYLTDAPYLVLLFKQTYGLEEDGKKKVHYYHEISTSIAAGLFIAAAQWAGLVTLTSTPLNCGPALRRLLSRPDNEKLLFLLPVGYPAEDATVPQLERKQLDQIRVYI